MKNILITGVSTGIGYGATQEFIQNGYRVYGSERKKEDADRLRKTSGKSYTPLIFDLSNYESIREAARQLEKVVGDEGLAGLINNAGASRGGPLMHVPLDQFREENEFRNWTMPGLTPDRMVDRYFAKMLES